MAGYFSAAGPRALPEGGGGFECINAVGRPFGGFAKAQI